MRFKLASLQLLTAFVGTLYNDFRTVRSKVLLESFDSEPLVGRLLTTVRATDFPELTLLPQVLIQAVILKDTATAMCSVRASELKLRQHPLK